MAPELPPKVVGGCTHGSASGVECVCTAPHSATGLSLVAGMIARATGVSRDSRVTTSLQLQGALSRLRSSSVVNSQRLKSMIVYEPDRPGGGHVAVARGHGESVRELRRTGLAGVEAGVNVN